VARPVIFLDTSFLIALENQDDPHHPLAKKLDRKLLRQKATLVLHRGIELEIGDGYAHENRRQYGVELLQKIQEEDRYWLVPITETLIQKARQLYRDRKDKEWGLTDCVSFALMKQEGITEALTADVHFRQAGFTALLLEPA
jgi:uncharacterized protein